MVTSALKMISKIALPRKMEKFVQNVRSDTTSTHPPMNVSKPKTKLRIALSKPARLSAVSASKIIISIQPLLSAWKLQKKSATVWYIKQARLVNSVKKGIYLKTSKNVICMLTEITVGCSLYN